MTPTEMTESALKLDRLTQWEYTFLHDIKNLIETGQTISAREMLRLKQLFARAQPAKAEKRESCSSTCAKCGTDIGGFGEAKRIGPSEAVCFVCIDCWDIASGRQPREASQMTRACM